MTNSVTLAVPTTGYMHHEFVSSLAAVVGSGLIQALNIVPRLPIHQARQRLVETSTTDTILFIDDDMVFTPQDVEQLLASEGDIVAGLAVTRSVKPKPVAFSWRDDHYEFRDGLPVDGVVDVDATTLAFTKISSAVFRDIGTAFQFRSDMGEDLDFCDRARAAGYTIRLNTGIKVGHLHQEALYG